MKMMKVLPSVILASLLMTGCTLKAGESYNTKKYKNEVTCAEFYEAFNKGVTETAKIPAMIPPEGFDASIKGSLKNVNSMSSKFNGKNRQKQASSVNEQINAEYDADNRMGHSKVNSTMKIEYKAQYGEMAETATQKVKGEFYGKETKKSETEYVVNIASVAAHNGGGLMGTSLYAASKGAVISFSKGIARELAPFGVRVNSIAPASIDTPMTTVGRNPAEYAATIKKIPLGRRGKPEEVVGPAVLLLSDESSFMVGVTLDVNGGVYMY